MLKKRLVSVVTIRRGLVVQSFGYKNYLPIGKPEVVVENLDRWGADEILLQCIDRSKGTFSGPDFLTLENISKIGISTPLIYAGGIRHAEDAVKAVALGADRVMVDALLWESPKSVEELSYKIGSQAIIANFPLRCEFDTLIWKNHRNMNEVSLTKTILEGLPLEHISELMLTDFINEGIRDSFDSKIARLFPIQDKPLILFGGISELQQYRELLAPSNIVALCVGNFLNYKEHAIQKIRQGLVDSPIRSAHYPV
jgi:imidazole glycerol-phosphate synthase subunit HisF